MTPLPLTLALCLFGAAGEPVLAGGGQPSPPGPAPRRGLPFVDPLDDRTCPASHPIKAVVTPRTRECVYHVPGSMHYRATRPELCFATEEAARGEDCWRAEEVL